MIYIANESIGMGFTFQAQTSMIFISHLVPCYKFSSSLTISAQKFCFLMFFFVTYLLILRYVFRFSQKKITTNSHSDTIFFRYSAMFTNVCVYFIFYWGIYSFHWLIITLGTSSPCTRQLFEIQKTL